MSRLGGGKEARGGRVTFSSALPPDAVELTVLQKL
jgi:hypothetical protein